MRKLEEMFSQTLFLGTGRETPQDEDRLWMIAEHLREDETALAFVSTKRSNLLLTEKRLLELRPHLDIQGFWNVLSFKGYAPRREIYLREVVGFVLEPEEAGGRVRIQVGDEEVVLPAPLAGAGREAEEDLRSFGTCLEGLLLARKDSAG